MIDLISLSKQEIENSCQGDFVHILKPNSKDSVDTLSNEQLREKRGDSPKL